MNFEEFKNRYFDGDEEKAMVQLSYEAYHNDYQMTETAEKLKLILDSMDRKTANRYMDFFMEEIRKKPAKFKKIMSACDLLQQIKMSENEVLAAKKNPFVKKLLINVLIILAGIFVMAMLLLIPEIAEFESESFERLIAYGATLFIGFRSMGTANSLMNIFRFKKVKKHLLEEKKETPEEKPREEIKQGVIENVTKDAIEETSVDKREVITRAYCVKEVQGFHSDRKSMYFAFTITVLIVFGLLCIASLLFALPGIALAVLCILMHEKHSNVLSAINKQNYYITTDVCTNKKFKVDSDNGSVYGRTLFFAGGKRYKINMAYKGIYYQDGSEAWLYDSVGIGDTCYLLQINGGKDVTLAFPVKEYRLAETEFYAEGEKIYPIKDGSVETVLSDGIKAQIEEMSSIQKNAIVEAEKNLKKMIRSRNTYIGFSFLVFITTLLGIVFDLILLLNLFVQPLWFIIPAIPAFSAMFKSASAVDRVSMDYIDYYKLRNRQNASVVIIFLLLADIVVYFLNFFQIVMMHT